MFDRKSGFEYKAAIVTKAPGLHFDSRGQVAFHGMELHTRGSALTTKKPQANNIHWRRALPLIHIQGDLLTVYTAEEITELGTRQHGEETVSFPIRLARQWEYTQQELEDTLIRVFDGKFALL